MKLPYRCGEWYELPLGDGSAAFCAIVRVFHHVVDIAVHAEPGAPAAAVLRVSDRALVLHRWKRAAVHAPVEPLEPENAAWISPARAERIAAARLGRAISAEASLDVRGLRSGDAVAGTMLSWCTPLDAATLDAVREYVVQHPDTALRPYGAAASQLELFASSPARTVHLCELGAGVFPNVHTLHVEAPVDLARIAPAFPNVRAMRIAVRGIDVDASVLPRGVRALDCSHARSVTVEGAAWLRALRLAWIERAPNLETLPKHLRDLAIEYCALDALAPIAALGHLEQLELHGLWHFDLADAQPLLAMPSLHRASIDIGGRRKNVELYKRARWAYPHPFVSVMERAASGNTFEHAEQ